MQSLRAATQALETPGICLNRLARLTPGDSIPSSTHKPLALGSTSSDEVRRGFNQVGIVLALVFVVVGAFSHSASAQGSWSGSISGGYATGIDNSDYTHGSLALALGIFGAPTRKLGFGAEIGYDHHENRSELVADVGRFEYDRSAWHLTAMLRLRSPRGSVRPYGVAGVGVYALRQDNEDFFAPGLNLGGGLELRPSDGPLGITVGARLHVAGKPGDDVLQGAGFLALLLGVTYR